MQIKSAKFGVVDIDDSSIIEFPKGIPGFEDKHRFTMLRCDQTEPIQWMQNLEDEYVVFPVLNPFIINPEYFIEVNDEDLEVIGTKDEEEIIVVCIMVIPEDLREMTANFMSPVLVNTSKMLGAQIMMDHREGQLRINAYEKLLEYYNEEDGDAGTD